MARLRLFDLVAFGTTARVDHLDDVQTGRAAQHFGHFAAPQPVDGLGEQGGQTVGLTPTDHPAVARVGRLGELDGQLLEGFAGFVSLEDVGGRALRRGDFILARVLGQAQQDVGDQQFALAGFGLGRVGQVVVDFRVGDDDAAVDLALAQSRNEDFLAQILAEALPGKAIAAQGLTQFVLVQAGVVADARDRALHGRFVDGNAVLARELQLRAFEHETLQNLIFEHLARRQLDALATQLPDDAVHRVAQLRGSDGLIVDHRDDAVGRNRTLRERFGRDRDGERQEDEGEKSMHLGHAVQCLTVEWLAARVKGRTRGRKPIR